MDSNYLVIGALVVLVIVMVVIQFSGMRHLKRMLTNKIHISVFINNLKIQTTMFQLKDDQQVKVKISAVDKKGQPATFEKGSVKFTSSDENVATVVPNPDDETEVTVVAGLPGVANITVEADSDLGEGVKTLNGASGVEVISGDAASFSFAVGTPEAQAAEGSSPAGSAAQS